MLAAGLFTSDPFRRKAIKIFLITHLRHANYNEIARPKPGYLPFLTKAGRTVEAYILFCKWLSD